jgi:hypothetical protein
MNDKFVYTICKREQLFMASNTSEINNSRSYNCLVIKQITKKTRKRLMNSMHKLSIVHGHKIM